jgi:hypothetical protein
MRLPRELNNVLIDDGDTFSEEFGRKIHCLQDLAGFHSLLAKRRSARKSRALVQKPASILQPLRKCGRVVWIDMDNAKTVSPGSPSASRLIIGIRYQQCSG